MTDATEAAAANIALVTEFWAALGRRDFAAVGAFMADDGHYVDVPVIGIDEGSRFLTLGLYSNAGG